LSITWANERRKLADLLPWPRNPRQITKDQAKRLVESFDQFGQVETIAIGPDNGVYNGHQRLAVLAQQHGKDYEIEVRVASRALTEKEREKLTVFLHKGAAGEWDWDTLSEFDTANLLEWGFSEVDLQLAPGAEKWGAAMDGLPEGDRLGFQQMTFTLSDEQAEQVKAATARAKHAGSFVDTGNENGNGNALARICEDYLGRG
jgi:ParB family chromosome partitioning protein